MRTTADDINSVFREYYKSLYESSADCAITASARFLENLKLAWIEGNEREYLDAPVTEAEVREAIRSLGCGKALWPDGLVLKFYKTYIDSLLPHLLNMFEEAIHMGQLPPSV